MNYKIHKLSNIYDFYYEYSDTKRKSLIGSVIEEKVKYKHNGKVHKREYTYFPIDLMCDWNYRKDQGLLILTPIQTHFETKELIFKVGAFSPDDLDIDLWFENIDKKIYNQVFNYMVGMNKKGSYKYFVDKIQKEFKDLKYNKYGW